MFACVVFACAMFVYVVSFAYAVFAFVVFALFAAAVASFCDNNASAREQRGDNKTKTQLPLTSSPPAKTLKHKHNKITNKQTNE